MPTENKPTQSEVKRYRFKGAAGEYVYAGEFDNAVRCFLDAAERCLAAERREQALQQRLNAADQRIDELTVPAGYCLMPTRLTAENGAKALLLGEFKLEVTNECPECRELEDPLEGCEVCDGEGEYGQQHMIPWDQIKFIYSEAVKGLAKNPNTPL